MSMSQMGLPPVTEDVLCRDISRAGDFEIPTQADIMFRFW